ncbi:hypothetical protein ARMGADRAFT_1088489 [Armillaria gallica]|uniref:Uncharacterized protein n=1 Tax=Armillaria gallica TaxID=47427 RepID=A0A2H3CMK6_ARMGA|nr:hypothetical protein ARMGADRAFT_1088489 [Armillaria gallica]
MATKERLSWIPQCYLVRQVDFAQKGKDSVPHCYFVNFLPFVRQLTSASAMLYPNGVNTPLNGFLTMQATPFSPNKKTRSTPTSIPKAPQISTGPQDQARLRSTGSQDLMHGVPSDDGDGYIHAGELAQIRPTLEGLHESHELRDRLSPSAQLTTSRSQGDEARYELSASRDVFFKKFSSFLASISRATSTCRRRVSIPQHLSALSVTTRVDGTWGCTVNKGSVGVLEGVFSKATAVYRLCVHRVSMLPKCGLINALNTTITFRTSDESIRKRYAQRQLIAPDLSQICRRGVHSQRACGEEGMGSTEHHYTRGACREMDLHGSRLATTRPNPSHLPPCLSVATLGEDGAFIFGTHAGRKVCGGREHHYPCTACAVEVDKQLQDTLPIPLLVCRSRLSVNETTWYLGALDERGRAFTAQSTQRREGSVRGENSTEDLGVHAEGGMAGEDGMKGWLYAIIRLEEDG